jgi:hypothetical protein
MLNYGQQWTLYMLMAESSMQSELRVTVLGYIATGMSPNVALAQAAREQVDASIQNSDIGALSNLNPSSLMTALSMAGYDPTLGKCPGTQDQNAIAAALLSLTGGSAKRPALP